MGRLLRCCSGSIYEKGAERGIRRQNIPHYRISFSPTFTLDRCKVTPSQQSLGREKSYLRGSGRVCRSCLCTLVGNLWLNLPSASSYGKQS